MTTQTLTQARLKEVLNYDASTGIFTHKIGRGGSSAGTEAGTLSSTGHRDISIDYVLYKAHRLAWLYIYGIFPVAQIDHIMGVRDDNRITKIRDVSNSGNQRNQAMNHKNKSGVLGVHWEKARHKWVVHIGMNDGKRAKYLGRFTDYFEAVCARKSAEVALGYHLNHGRAA